MQKIISKPTASFKSWLATYLDHDQMDHFLSERPEIESIEHIKTDIITMICDNDKIRNSVKLTLKKNKRWSDLVDKNLFIMKHLRNALNQALIDDFIINDGHHKPHVMNSDDLISLKDALLNYLHHHLSIADKINWILHHRTISDKTLGRKIWLKPEEVNGYTKHPKKISQMKLESATRCAKYYDEVVRKQLIKS